jgi:hypothetical protein
MSMEARFSSLFVSFLLPLSQAEGKRQLRGERGGERRERR